MTVEQLRVLAIAASTLTVLVVIFSLAWRWEERSVEIRAKGIVFAYFVCLNDYAVWYARHSHLPLNSALYLLLPGCVAAVAVYVYFLVRHPKES